MLPLSFSTLFTLLLISPCCYNNINVWSWLWTLRNNHPEDSWRSLYLEHFLKSKCQLCPHGIYHSMLKYQWHTWGELFYTLVVCNRCLTIDKTIYLWIPHIVRLWLYPYNWYKRYYQLWTYGVLAQFFCLSWIGGNRIRNFLVLIH